MGRGFEVQETEPDRLGLYVASTVTALVATIVVVFNGLRLLADGRGL